MNLRIMQQQQHIIIVFSFTLNSALVIAIAPFSMFYFMALNYFVRRLVAFDTLIIILRKRVVNYVTSIACDKLWLSRKSKQNPIDKRAYGVYFQRIAKLTVPDS